jgi:hydrophobe/amphiphile efflux-3 (HAE3) family protein
MWLADFVLEHKYLCLVAFTLLTLLFLSGIPNLYIDNSMETLFLENNPQLEVFDLTLKEFGTELGAVVAFQPDVVFSNQFLSVLNHITGKIQEMEHVEAVYSLTHLDYIQAEGDVIRVGPLIPHLPVPEEKLKRIRRKALDDPFVVGHVVSEDATTAAIIIKFTYIPDDDTYCHIAVQKIREILAEEIKDSFEYHLSGIHVLVAVMNEYCLKDLKVFLPVGILVIFLVLAFVYRTFSGIIVTIGAILLTVLWTLGLMGLFHVPITVATTMLPLLIMVISVSDAVHLITQYYEGIAHGQDKLPAIKTAVYKVGTPCFLTSLTTAIGFSSLLLSELQPVRDFGLYAAIGIFFAFVISIILVPIAFFYLPPPTLNTVKRLRAGRLTRAMERIAGITHNHPYTILGWSGIIMVLGIFGITKIRVDTTFFDYFYRSDPAIQSINFIDRHLTGIEPLRILLHTGEKDGSKNPAFLKKVDNLEAFLRNYPEVSRVFAMPDLLKRLHRLLHGDAPAYDRLPESRELVAEYLLLLSLAGGDELMEFLASWDLSTVQVVAMMRLVGSKRQTEILKDLEAHISKYFDTTISYEMTDSAALNPILANNLVHSQIKTFSLSLLLIFITMSILFRSIQIGLLCIIPNIIPLTISAGLMGLSGITLNVVTVMVASIAIGIAVDDTIHILTRYRIEFYESSDPTGAMTKTLSSSGRAIVFTSIVLMAGFLIPLFSSFRLPCYFGILGATTMAGALFADLFVLPALFRVSRPFLRIQEMKMQKRSKPDG